MTGHAPSTVGPRALIRETAQRLARRIRNCLLLPIIPVGVVIVALGALDSLPPELVGAWTITTIVLALALVSAPDQTRVAANRLDASIGGKAHFLTLATVSETDKSSPLLSLVYEQATHLSSGKEAKDLIPPLPRRPIVASAIMAIAIFLVATRGPIAGPVLGPIERLERLAAAMETSGDQSGASALRKAIESLRDPERSAEERRAAAEQAMHEFEQQNGGDDNSSGTDSKGTGSESNGEGNDPGNDSASLRDQARSELEEMTGQTSGGEKTNGSDASPSGDSSKGAAEMGNKEESAGGSGLDAPRSDKVGERQDSSPGNRPGDAEREVGEGSSGTGSQQQGMAQKDQAGEGTGDANSPGQRPMHPAERPGHSGGKLGNGNSGGDEEGEIADGRFVRVRIPNASVATTSERVRGPGKIRLKTPPGNAPLPEAGGPDAVRARQPIPLEYRKALEGT